ncbi:unnamed protein product, partial [Heterotrigona itama]
KKKKKRTQKKKRKNTDVKRSDHAVAGAVYSVRTKGQNRQPEPRGNVSGPVCPINGSRFDRVIVNVLHTPYSRTTRDEVPRKRVFFLPAITANSNGRRRADVRGKRLSLLGNFEGKTDSTVVTSDTTSLRCTITTV